MRMRKKAWALPELEQCPYFVQNPAEYKGRWREFFGNDKPIHVELGCGKCVFTAELAAQNRDINYIAIDISSDILGVARRNFEARYAQDNEKVNNVALVEYNIERINSLFDENDNIERIYINFCNPWPKVRHHKRRLTHTLQLEKYKLFAASGSQLHFKTDDTDLFAATVRYLNDAKLEISWQTSDLYACNNAPISSITTEHEQMFTAQGIKIKALIALFG